MTVKDGFLWGIGFFIAATIFTIVTSIIGTVLFGGIIAAIMSGASS